MSVIYILTCSACGKQYVGETCTCMMLRRRVTLHRQHIKTPQYRILGVNRHTAECGRGNFSVTPFYVLLNAYEEAGNKRRDSLSINLNLN